MLTTAAAISAYLAVLSGPTPQPHPTDFVEDSRLVYCSFLSHRQALADAAGALEVYSPGPSPGFLGAPSFEEWRRQRPQDFSRACNILIAANRLDTVPPPTTAPSTAPNLWPILISAGVGAFLTLLGGEWKSRRDRQTLAAQALRNAAATFRRAGNAAIKVLASPMANSDGTAYYAARDELASRLNESAAVRKSALDPKLLDEILGTKADSVVGAWPQDAAARKTREDQATQWLKGVEADAVAVAAAVQRTWAWRKQSCTAQTKPIDD